MANTRSLYKLRQPLVASNSKRQKNEVHMVNSLVAYEQALLTDIELLLKNAARGEAMRATDIEAARTVQ